MFMIPFPTFLNHFPFLAFAAGGTAANGVASFTLELAVTACAAGAVVVKTEALLVEVGAGFEATEACVWLSPALQELRPAAYCS